MMNFPPFSPESLTKFKWPVSAAKLISASSAEIWEIISTPANLEVCHPFCQANPVEVWPGSGSKDSIHYYSGWIFKREFVSWHPGRGYDLLIGEETGRKSLVSWRIASESKEKSRLRITIYPATLQTIPPWIRMVPHFLYLGPRLRRYLDAVLQGFAWYLETGKAVQKNQFGPHPWFSN